MHLIRLTLALSLVGCASSTVIHSDPPGATFYVNESLVGFTPYSYMDRRPAFSTVKLRLQKDGYEPLEVTPLTSRPIPHLNPCRGLFRDSAADWV